MTIKIEFYSSVSGVVDSFPIQYSKESIPEWLSLAKHDYLKNKQSLSIFRCPGIVEILTSGFTVTTWHDIEIKANNLDELYGVCPSEELETLLGYPPIQIQKGDGISKHLPKRPWSHRDILKINTPWCVMVPRDIKLLVLPLSYSTNFLFEASAGILDPSISNAINIQGYINSLGLIKAGTPIAQIIPLTEKKYELIVRDMNESDKIWQKKKKYLNCFSFILNRKKIKESYLKHVGA